jgi:hypothetical protein
MNNEDFELSTFFKIVYPEGMDKRCNKSLPQKQILTNR